jgi:predicted NBD/HSP70 family sugar kinase
MRKIDLTNFQVATSETARHINRRIALNIIRRYQPMSRAELARRSGLQRSTVSAIIGQLIAEGWVTEGASPVSSRGRRPRFLHLNGERAGILAVDLRPVTTRVGLAGLDARFLMQTTWPTPGTPEAFASELARTVAAFRSAHPEIVYEGMGVSLPGRVDPAGRLVFAPNLHWEPVDLKQVLESAVGLPVVLENAASACALAELWFGRQPDDVKDLVAVTVSEGIGVGMLLNGQLIHGRNAMAGEFGHVTLDEDGPLCSCGKRGCWEQYASNSAAVRYYQRLLGGAAAAPAEPPPSPAALKFTDILRLADDGDTRAIETLEHMARYLGIGLAPLVTGLAPQVLVIIGEVTAAWDRVGPIILDVVKRRTLPSNTTQIVPTDPAMQPRLRGAVTLVVQQYFGAPNVA